MMNGPSPGDNDRIGNYPVLNYIPDAMSGTYRQVWEHKPVPGAGAAEYAYMTRLTPIMDPIGAGMPLLMGAPPNPRSAAPVDHGAVPWLVVPQPDRPMAGTTKQPPLLPDDVVAGFAPIAAMRARGLNP